MVAFSAPQRLGAVDDARGEEDHQLGSCVTGSPSLKQEPEQGNVAKEWDLIEVASVLRVNIPPMTAV
jgi:hypothetical protein